MRSNENETTKKRTFLLSLINNGWIKTTFIYKKRIISKMSLEKKLFNWFQKLFLNGKFSFYIIYSINY